MHHQIKPAIIESQGHLVLTVITVYLTVLFLERQTSDMIKSILPDAFVTACFITAAALTCNPAFSQYVGQNESVLAIHLTISGKAQSFNLQDIKLLDGRFKENLERDAAWMLSISNARLLYTWRLNAGITANAQPLGGWEAPDCELRGHTLGHILSGLSLM